MNATQAGGRDHARVAVVAAGGTGGHMFPAEAVARVLAARGWRVVLATDPRGERYAETFPAEERLTLDAATFRNGDALGVARAGSRIVLGVGQALKAFRRSRPRVVVGFGGYPSLPAMLAARVARIPTVLHEQNAVLGRVNRFLQPYAGAVACAFPIEGAGSARSAAIHVVGNPVRHDIRALHDRPYPPLATRVRILVTGGSQGARLLSELVPNAVARLGEDLRLRLTIEQQTRDDAIEEARRVYAEARVDAEVAPFFRDMAERLARAHIVIGRAGASTVCELAVAGRPSILVPLASAADDHQTANARLLERAGAARVLPEAGLTAARLAATLAEMIGDPEGLAHAAAAARASARPDAAERLADLVERTAA